MKKVHIVTYTHWDREFRWEFERTRMRLVDMFDHLFEIMEKSPDYRSFLCDGQLTLIADYLEIRPEMEETVRKYVKEGRLEIGPWFTLADCAPIQGESVVRNIQYGTKKSKELGGLLKCGYNVFSFGQIGQLPQIYADFDIDTIIFYKYMDPKKSKYHEFIWEAPDGTKAFASHLGPEARWNFFFAGHIPIVYDKDAWHKDWQYKWGELGKVFHTANPDDYGWFYDILDPETSFHPENLRKGMERALKTVEGTAAPDCVLMFDGTDFTEPHPLTPEYIKALQKEYEGELEIVHSTLTDYLAELKAKLKEVKDLDLVKGPMRDGPVGSIHTDVFSTHPEVIIANSHTENTVIRYAEPMSTIAWKFGLSKYPAKYLEKIWKLMFQSHAHDSMHGLGPATLVDGEMSRLEQAGIIAKGLERKGLENITKEIDTSKVSDTEYFLAVHNPSSFERSEIVEAYVDIPKDVILKYIIIEDMNGNPVKVQEVERKENIRAGIYHPRSRNMPYYATKVHLFFEADNIPALGFKTYKIKWAEKNIYPYPHEDWDAPRILADNMLTGANQAENEYIKVKVNPDGTVNITDKKTGKEYKNLNYFTDMGDKGNMWTFDNIPCDNIITSIGEKARVSTTVNGPLCVKFKADLTMKLPQNYDFAKQLRSETLVDIPVSVEFTLKKGSRYLEVNTTIDNTAKDHYFKVCMPTGLDAEKTYAEGSFMVTEYPTKPSVDGEVRGNELARHPFQLWCDTIDKKNGFAILSDAAKDYEILENDEDCTIAMGLVRGTRLRIACDNRLWMEYHGDESAQDLQKLSYRYAFMPHTDNWENAKLYNEGLAFNAPLKVCEFGKQEGIFGTEKSFVTIEGENLILSSVTKSESDSTVIRLYNPTEKEINGKITLGLDIKKATHIRLDGKEVETLDVKDNTVSVKVGKGKIYTVEVM
jgi:mannosylglycerate hydrolase